MHHNICKNICSNCRTRDCNNKCSLPKLCSNCLGNDHTATNCKKKPYCNNCKNNAHINNSNICPANRLFIKEKFIARKPSSTPSSTPNAWANRPKIPVMDLQQPIPQPAKPQAPIPQPRTIHITTHDQQPTQEIAAKKSDPKIWLLSLMYAAIACKTENYCLNTFHTTHAEFCTKNGIENTSLPDPTTKMIDHLASGNCSVTQDKTPATSIQNTSEPARESPNPPSAVQPAVVESRASQGLEPHHFTFQGITKPAIRCPARCGGVKRISGLRLKH